jgi:hypothetical protein
VTALAVVGLALVVSGPARATVDTPTVAVSGDDVSGDAGGGGTAAGTGPSTGAGSGEQIAFTDVRVGRDGDVERVVWEFAGPGMPGWMAEYTDDPRQDGSGAPIPLTGSAALQVVITGVGIPTDVELPPGTTPYDAGPQLLSPASTSIITEVFPGATFEGQQLGAIGLDRRAPFRVYRLDDPTRIVVEIVDEAASAAPTGIPAGDGSAGWGGPMALPAALVLVVALIGGAAVWSAVRRRGIA